MPSSELHYQQYRKNRNFLDSLHRQDSTAFDWMITISFYSALHIIERFLAGKNIHPVGHDSRKKYIGTVKELKTVRDTFTVLQWESEQTRYNCASPNIDKVRESIGYLEEVEKALL